MKIGLNSNDTHRTKDGGKRAGCGINFISKGKHSQALWAMNLYDRLGFKRNIHIRRIHYWALLQNGLTLPNGKTYRNTVSDYAYLKRAFENARLLGFVPYDVFSDANRFSGIGFDVSAGLISGDKVRQQLLKQMIEKTCRSHMKNMLARFARVHVEVWLEQTTADDLVSSLADKYHLKILARQGDIPLTNIWHFVRRLGSVSKPVRILYICDFDPQNIHDAAADKVTAAMTQYGLSRKVDLKIKKLALGLDECKKYDLPPTPETNPSTTHPTELHALEVAAPGFLCKTLEKYINHYCDRARLRNAEKQIDESINRLMIKINRKIDQNSDIYEFLDEIQSRVSSN